VENFTFKNLQIYSPDLPFIVSTLPEIKIRNLRIEDSNFSIFVEAEGAVKMENVEVINNVQDFEGNAAFISVKTAKYF